MRIWSVILLLSCAIAFADDKIASVQQALKDQGFYYGDITGEKNADTTAAIRRFQIRNGLQINGELNDETLKAIRAAPSAAAAPTPPSLPRATTPAPEASTDLREEPEQAPNQMAPPEERFVPPPQDREAPPVYQGRVPRTGGGNFAGTPYETAPPEVQQDVIAKAQKRLAKRDLYRGEINGAFGPDMEFSLRAYQARVGLQPTGQLDLATLAALELLPGAGAPVFTPRRGARLPPGTEPPVRGEWVRP